MNTVRQITKHYRFIPTRAPGTAFSVSWPSTTIPSRTMIILKNSLLKVQKTKTFLTTFSVLRANKWGGKPGSAVQSSEGWSERLEIAANHTDSSGISQAAPSSSGAAVKHTTWNPLLQQGLARSCSSASPARSNLTPSQEGASLMKPHESSIGVSGDSNPGAFRVGLQHPSPQLSLAETRCGGSRRRAQPRRRNAGSRAGTLLPSSHLSPTRRLRGPAPLPYLLPARSGSARPRRPPGTPGAAATERAERGWAARHGAGQRSYSPRSALLLSRAGCACPASGEANSGQQHLENLSRRAGPGRCSRLRPPPRAAARPKWQRRSATPAAAPGAGPGEPQPMAAGPGRDAAEPRAGVSPPLAWSAVRSPERWGARAGLARRRGRVGRGPHGAAHGPVPACPSPAAVPEEQTLGGSVTKIPQRPSRLPHTQSPPRAASPALSEVHGGPARIRSPPPPLSLGGGRDHRGCRCPAGCGGARLAPPRLLPPGSSPSPTPAPLPRPARRTAGDGGGLRLRSRSGGRWPSHGGGPGAGEVRDGRQREERPRERAACAGPLRRSGPGSAARPGQRWAGAGGPGAASPGPAAPRCETSPSSAGLCPLCPHSPSRGAPRGERGLQLLLPCLPHRTWGACRWRLETRLVVHPLPLTNWWIVYLVK